MVTNHHRPVVMLSGGSQGLGFALSRVLLQSGFTISTCARHLQSLEMALVELQTYGPIFGIAGDVAEHAFRQRWIEQTVEKFGRIDAVVHNASTLGDTPLPTIASASLDSMRQVHEVNVVAPIALTQLALPYFRRNTRSLVIAISSDAAIGGYPGWGVYGNSKAALELLHQTLASELASDPAYTSAPVWVYVVDPGDMDTAMHHAASPGDADLMPPSQVAQAMSVLFTVLNSSDTAAIPSGSRCVVHVDQVVVTQREQQGG